MHIQRMFSTIKNENFIGKNDIFNIFAQNIDCWYTLEPPRRGGSNEYSQFMLLIKVGKNEIPVYPSFTPLYIKVLRGYVVKTI